MPGGLLTAAQVETLAGLTETLGDGSLHLTARGNVEIRSIRDPAPLQAGLGSADLLPAPTHERMRNIVASPPAALSPEATAAGVRSPGVLAPGMFAMRPGSIDLAPTVRALDAALVGEPDLARLSGRFLFGLDGGLGDVLALQPDLAIVLLPDGPDGPGHACRLVCGGDDSGPVLALSEAPAALVTAARAFLDIAGSAWRVDDLPDARAAAARIYHAVTVFHAAPGLAAAASEVLTVVPSPAPASAPSMALVAALPLGTAGGDAWRALAALARRGDGLVRTTPWRSAVVAGLTLDDARHAVSDLPEHGLVTDPDDPWSLIGACTGLPGCAGSHADVHGDAAQLRDELRDRLPGMPVYLSGCPRRCGHPRAAHVEAVAGTAADGVEPAGGYAVACAAPGGSAAGHTDSQLVPAGALAAAVRLAPARDAGAARAVNPA